MNTSLQAQEGLYTDTAGKTLPDGWERHETVYGIAYYIDRVTEVTSWESPVLVRMPFSPLFLLTFTCSLHEDCVVLYDMCGGTED